MGREINDSEKLVLIENKINSMYEDAIRMQVVSENQKELWDAKNTELVMKRLKDYIDGLNGKEQQKSLFDLA